MERADNIRPYDKVEQYLYSQVTNSSMSLRFFWRS